MTGPSGTDAYCQVALPKPVFQTFSYRVPPHLRKLAVPGVRVRVPFGRQREIGILQSIGPTPPDRSVKDVLEVLDDGPVLSPALVRLCRWTADYYAAQPNSNAMKISP